MLPGGSEYPGVIGHSQALWSNSIALLIMFICASHVVPSLTAVKHHLEQRRHIDSEREQHHAKNKDQKQRISHLASFHFSRIVFNDSCSASLTTSQRFQATGSINFLISRLTQPRRLFGSIASNSQQ